MSKSKEQVVELTVVRVCGGGNAGNGRYFYSFTPELLMTGTAGPIAYRLSTDSSTGLRIRAVVDSASAGQMDAPVITPDGREAVVQNNLIKAELINVAVVVVDAEHPNLFIKCDPQVLNVPEI